MVRRIDDGSPEPLGLTLDERGANVAVFSAHATAIELCLFDATGKTEVARLRLPARTGDVFHGHFEGLAAGQRYGLRAHGPYAPAEGHRFNPAKLLVDPYALALDRPFTLSPAMFGGEGSPDPTDSAPVMPKAVAVAMTPRPALPPASQRLANRAAAVIYELHVRGFTKRLTQIPEQLRGTFGGLAHPAAISHLTRLGVTVVEIMPCAAWVDERHLQSAGLSNYWGYNPVALMAPDLRLAPNGWEEIRAAVAALQAAGIEVIVDVVLNHTGEGDAFGPTLSLRGLDNATYYRHTRDVPHVLINDSGCGNTIALDRPPVVRLAMDTLRTWARLGGINGFRFDLATALGRRDDGFDAAAPLITAIAQDPVLRDLRMIAESWDIGPGGYQVGAFPAGWGEWNDQFRDSVRKFWRGDGGVIGDLATRLSGSSDIFAARHRRPSDSVNFIVAHDGFTLADLVSYERKHNDANGEANRDGTNANFSWNNGEEGPASNPSIAETRRRDQRNLLATLLLSRGTPMLTMGAEFGNSQGGNNNAYAQDNATSWLDWDGADMALAKFTARLTTLRAAHQALTLDRFLTGELVDDKLIPDVDWLTADGRSMQTADWSDPQGRTLIAVLYAPAQGTIASDRVIVVLHAGREPIEIALPEARVGFAWRRSIDTANDAAEASFLVVRGQTSTAQLLETQSKAHIAERSVVLFAETFDAVRYTHPAEGPDPKLLDRVARAVGISPDWYDIYGNRHVVPDATKRMVLEDMGFAAKSNPQLRESLGQFAEEMDRRVLPLTSAAYEGEPVRLRIAVPSGRLPSALLVHREDGETVPLRLTPDRLEHATTIGSDGRRIDIARAELPPQPVGRHRIVCEGGAQVECALTVAPRACFLPSELFSGKRALGIAAQLYSLRRAGDQGIGDLTTLAELAEIAGARCLSDRAKQEAARCLSDRVEQEATGVMTVGLNPLHALFPGERDRASPYYPSDRRFLDPIYIDVTVLGRMTGFNRASAALDHAAGHFAEQSAKPQVDYPGVWALKQAVLEAAFIDFEALSADAPLRSEFNAFVAAGGTALREFALFQAIAEAHKDEDWTSWPAALAHREPTALNVFAEAHAARERFYLYLQWLADRQLGEADARGRAAGLQLGFYRDLAVGAAPDGAESWSNADQLLRRTSIGAPPDPFAEGGQDWGLQPPNPLAWQRSGYGFFNELLAANMRHAGALRIDHAMALARLFVIPQGAHANEGAYLAYPSDDLFAQLTLQSTKARCVVVGEDLGTVPNGFRERMDAANVLSYRVLWFERDGASFKSASAYPVKAVACVSTHDLPPVAGWWQGEDIREKEALGLISPSQAEVNRRERIADKVALLRLIGRDDLLHTLEARAPIDPSVIAAVHEFLANTPSLLAMMQIDDLFGETTAVNLPGTDRERLNWRRKLKGTVAKLRDQLHDLQR